MKNHIEVIARKRWNDSGIDIVKGQIVTIEASGKWTDDTIATSPDGFNRPWLHLVRWTRRAPRSPWFALIAVIGRRKRPVNHIGSEASFTADTNGRLYLYANDAWLFYFNNKGSIQATVKVEDPAIPV